MTAIEETLRRIVREEVARALSDWDPWSARRGEGQLPELLSLPQAASVLGVAEATLRDWRVDRKGPPAVKYGRLVKFRLEDLQQWTLEGRQL